MSTTMTPPPPSPSNSSPAAAAPTAAAPASARRSTGDAVHKDLYRTAKDPALEREELRDQARILGLGFFFFGLFITSASLFLNHGFSKNPAFMATLPAGAPMGQAIGALGDAQAVTVSWSNGATAHPLRIEALAEGRGHDRPTLEANEAFVPLWITGPEVKQERPAFSVVVAKVDGAKVTSLQTIAGTPVRPFPRLVHGIRSAKLLGAVPVHGFLSVCALLGLIGAVLPALLVPFYKLWMRYVAAPLGWFNTRLILSLFFFVMLTPVALFFSIRRMFKPELDPLARTARPGSYWKLRATQRPRNHFERTF